MGVIINIVASALAPLKRMLKRLVRYWTEASYVWVALLAGCGLALRPSTWVYPVRNRLARQILFAGVEAIPFTFVVAAVVGAVLYTQCLAWLEYTGEMDMLGRMIGITLFRVVAPFLSVFIVIGASASAITSEIANMKTSGEVALLESQGVNTFQYMAVPRMIGLAICVLGLSLIFVSVAILSSGIGFLFFSGVVRDPRPFFRAIFESLEVFDYVFLISLTVLPGLLMGAICCIEGLGVKGAVTEVPQAVSRAILGSICATIIAAVLFMLFANGVR